MYIGTRCLLDRCSTQVRAISSAFWEVVPMGRGDGIGGALLAIRGQEADAIHEEHTVRVRRQLIREPWGRGSEVLQELWARMSGFRGERGCRQQSSRV